MTVARTGQSIAPHFTRALLGAAVVAALSQPLRAQITLTHTEDAAPIPAGTVRFRMTTGWSRYDERFTGNGTRSISDDIATDSLGPSQFPLLAPVQAGLQTLTANPLTRLTLGHLDAQSDIRTVTTPIALELGITRRLSVGIMVPIIQTRRSIRISVNADSTQLANVGFVPARSRGIAASSNAVVYAAFVTAADSLSRLATRCAAQPSASGCAAVNGNSASIQALITQTQAFAAAIKTALGTDSASAVVAPRTGGAIAASITAREAQLTSQLQTYLGPSAGTSASVFTAATDFSYIDLQGRNGVPGFLQSTLGGGLDSLETTNKLTVGGVTFAAQWMVMDRFHYDTIPFSGVQSRLAVGGEARIETLPADSARQLGLVSSRLGSAVAVKSAMDVVRGRAGATIAARYEKGFARTVQVSTSGETDAFFVNPSFVLASRTPGDVITLDLTPRYLLTRWIALDAHYGIERTGAASYDDGAVCADPQSCTALPPAAAHTAQRVGFGFRYSTIDSYLRGAVAMPLEVSFTHLETITGDAGTPKIFRDQVQVRVYVPVFGNH